jgi:hypothetical protein
MHSSTRVGSVALLGNQEKVEYYRNDSPAKMVSKACRGWLGVPKGRGHILKYCRREEEKKRKSKGQRQRGFLYLLAVGLTALRLAGRNFFFLFFIAITIPNFFLMNPLTHQRDRLTSGPC